VLPVAAAAATRETAGRVPSTGAWPKDLKNTGFGELGFSGGEFDAQEVSRRRLVDKNNKAVVTGDAPSPDGHLFDLDLQ
jgi:hypothetical protein